jgi:hypothetical protein
VETLKQSISSGEDSPVYAKAPKYIRESLGFPYSYGLGFVQALLLKGGKDLAYAGALKNPPQTSREIMTPESYLSGERLQPLTLPRMSAILGKNYERYDVGAVGAFDLMVLLKQFTRQEIAEKMAPEWRGGVYYAALKHSPPDAKMPASNNGKEQKSSSEQPTTRSLAILYLSRWSSPEMALAFAKIYAAMLCQRYDSADLVDDPNTLSAANTPKNNSDQKSNTVAISHITSHWITNEGDVLIEAQGNTVLVLESFDAKTQSALREAVWQTAKMTSEGRKQAASK